MRNSERCFWRTEGGYGVRCTKLLGHAGAHQPTVIAQTPEADQIGNYVRQVRRQRERIAQYRARVGDDLGVDPNWVVVQTSLDAAAAALEALEAMAARTPNAGPIAKE